MSRTLVSARLDESIDDLAAHITRRQFSARPELDRLFGAGGRVRCTEDNVHHLEHLRDAVRAASTESFVDYVAWARVLLSSLRIPTEELRGNLRVLASTLEERWGDTAAPAVEIVGRALEVFDDLPLELDTLLPPDGRHAVLARRYLDELLRGDRRAASRRILEAVEGGVPIREIYLDVFQACQREIGRLWQLNRITVAQEHFCTAATQLVMSQLYDRIFSHRPDGRILVSTSVTEDLHELGVRMVSDFFEMEGWDTYYLGANTPRRDLLKTLVDRRADVLAVSVTLSCHLGEAIDLVRAVRSDPACGDTKVLVGGAAFQADPDLWRKVGADGWAPDAEAAVRVAARLTGEA